MSYKRIMKANCLAIIALILAVPMGVNAATVAVARPSCGALHWYILDTTTNQYTELLFGLTTDKPVFGDWNNDGIFDAGFARANGTTGKLHWYYSIERSGASNNLYGQTTYGSASLSDKPIGMDGNSNGKWQAGVTRPTDRGSIWYQQDCGPLYGVQYGMASDIPLWGDWDGDGTFSHGAARWNGSTGFDFWVTMESDPFTHIFVPAGAAAIPYAYYYNGSWDVAVFENGTHKIFDIANGNLKAIYQWGQAGDIPVFLGSTPPPPQTGLSNVTGYTQNIHSITVSCGTPKVLIDAWSDDIIRIWLSADGAFSYYNSYNSYMIQPGLDKFNGTNHFTVSDQGSFIQMRTMNLYVNIYKIPFRMEFYRCSDDALLACNPTTGQSLDTNVKAYFKRDVCGQTEHFFGLQVLGENTLDQRDMVRTLLDLDGYGWVAPFFMSTAGYGIFFS